jgi:hypothetical protein
MTEKVPTPEFTEEDQHLIAQLKEKGFEDPDVQHLLQEWGEKQAAETDQENIGRANIVFDLKRIKLCIAAGYIDIAREYLEGEEGGVLYAARQEGADDLYEEARQLLESIT